MQLSGLRVLSDAEIERIHAESLRILETAGVRVMDDDCLRVLESAGARVEGDRVRLPAALVEECRTQAPEFFALYRGDGTPVRVSTTSHVFGSLVIDPWIIDYQSQTPRRPRLDDVARHARLADALPTVSFLYRMDMTTEDYPDETAYIRTLAAVFSNTTKPLLAAPASRETLHYWLDVVEMITEDPSMPRVMIGAPVTTPLTFDPLNATILKEGLAAGLPFCAQTEPIAGTTAPYSFAGGLVLGNAENLFQLVLAQLLKPGAAFTYSIGNALTDMSNGRVWFYNPDKMLWKIAIAQMAGFYRLPLEGEATGSLVGTHDTQNGIEMALLMLPVLLGSGGMFNGLGSCYNACGFSAEMVVIGADLAALLQRMSMGFDADESLMNTDAILELGPGGNFLTEPFTIDMLYSGEFFTEGCFNRQGEQCPNRAEDGMLARAHARVESLVCQEPAVSWQTREALRRWVERRCTRIPT